MATHSSFNLSISCCAHVFLIRINASLMQAALRILLSHHSGILRLSKLYNYDSKRQLPLYLESQLYAIRCRDLQAWLFDSTSFCCIIYCTSPMTVTIGQLRTLLFKNWSLCLIDFSWFFFSFFSLTILSSSCRPSIKVKSYRHHVRQPITPRYPYTRNLLLALSLLTPVSHPTINPYDYSHDHKGAYYANQSDNPAAEFLLFLLAWGPRSGGGLWRIDLLRRRRQVFLFHICGVDARELGVGEVEAFSLHVGDVCAGEIGSGHGSLPARGEAHLERGIDSSVHALGSVWDLETGPANAVVGDTPL